MRVVEGGPLQLLYKGIGVATHPVIFMFRKLFEIYCSSEGSINRIGFWKYLGWWLLAFLVITFLLFGNLVVIFSQLGKLAFYAFVLLSLTLTLMPLYVKRGRDFGLPVSTARLAFLTVIFFPLFIVMTLVFGAKKSKPNDETGDGQYKDHLP